jgi:hypothetical protein
MQHAVAMLKQFGVPHEAQVISAHRMPDEMFAYAESARARGLRAIIAGAGGAAHLPGMVAAKTIVPVLGVPVPSQVPARRGFAAVDRADAEGRAGGDLRHRRSGRRQCGADRGRHDRRHRRCAGRASWKQFRAAADRGRQGHDLPLNE